VREQLVGYGEHFEGSGEVEHFDFVENQDGDVFSHACAWTAVELF
jgi:hypothetical protein